MFGIGQFLWRLVPANPILARVVAAGGKRKRDLFFRCGYLASLIAVVIWMLITSAGSLERSDLAALTNCSASIFYYMSYLQLALVALLAPVFTAGAITQERDSQTYDILLSTPLTNGQIVLGSLLSRLFFIVALLISGIPIFSITLVFGGVAVSSILQSFLIAGATAFVTGAMAMAIASFKVGTRRTLFSFYLFIMIYLLVPIALEVMGYGRVSGRTSDSHTSWFAGLNPFLSLESILASKSFNPPEPGAEAISGYSSLVQFYLTNPASFYVLFMMTLSLVLVTPSIIVLRRMAQTTSSIKSIILQKLHLHSGDKTRSVRRVWSNPIAWREAKTKASAARATFLRWVFMGGGVVGAIVMVVLRATSVPAENYISPEGFDPAHGRIQIVEKGKTTPCTLNSGYNSGFLVTFNGEPIPVSAIKPHMAVVNPGSAAQLDKLELTSPPTRLSVADARRFLLGAVLVELAAILLIVTQSAASTVTREKEDGTLDLILSTPITSRYYVWGKLRGLVSFILPLLGIPMFSILLFVVYDIIHRMGDQTGITAWVAVPESLLVLPGMMVMVCAFAAILGMQMSLRCRTTVMAVIVSVVMVMGACFGIGACGWSAMSSSQLQQGGQVLGSFSPFTLAAMLIDRADIASSIEFSDADGSNRFLVAIAGWIVTAVYAAVVWAMYRSMVRNFDMTIRKQTT